MLGKTNTKYCHGQANRDMSPISLQQHSTVKYQLQLARLGRFSPRNSCPYSHKPTEEFTGRERRGSTGVNFYSLQTCLKIAWIRDQLPQVVVLESPKCVTEICISVKNIYICIKLYTVYRPKYNCPLLALLGRTGRLNNRLFTGHLSEYCILSPPDIP